MDHINYEISIFGITNAYFLVRSFGESLSLPLVPVCLLLVFGRSSWSFLTRLRGVHNDGLSWSGLDDSTKLSHDTLRSRTVTSDADLDSLGRLSVDNALMNRTASDVLRKALPYMLSFWSPADIYDSVGEAGRPWFCASLNFACNL
jgi:hypothetical protein